MTTLLLTHPACLDHDMGAHHPESPARLRSVLRALDAPEFAALARAEAPLATLEQIARVHPQTYIEALRECAPTGDGLFQIDADTAMNASSWEAALRAAGAVVAAVDAVAEGRAANAFCAVRPPGHHAEPNNAMGFCLFNNVAVGALHARAAHGLRRVAVVDFDVHHGNGTQDMFYADPGLFFASTHQMGAYPGTGFVRERGIAGNIVNLPLPAGTGSGPWRETVETFLLPRLTDFRPDLLMISAGFDAHAADPLAEMRLEAEDFAWITRELMKIADDLCGGRVVSTLEGGYDLDALAESAAAHVRALMAGS